MDKKDKDQIEFDRLFRKWKRSVERSNLLQELRKRQYFEKPSEKRHRRNQSTKKQNQLRLAEARSVNRNRRRRA